MRSIGLSAIAAGALCFASLAHAQTQPAAPPDIASMSRSALQQELRAARPLVRSGGVTASRTPGCTDANHAQLDFWIGEWDVSPTGSDMVVAESTIRSLDQGCVIFEEWRPFQGPGGHSLSDYDPADGAWHQTWIDGAGARTMFDGHFENGVMLLNNVSPPPPGAPANLRRRMAYQMVDADTVHQWGEQFDEATQAWAATWDYTYKRRPGTRR